MKCSHCSGRLNTPFFGPFKFCVLQLRSESAAVAFCNSKFYLMLHSNSCLCHNFILQQKGNHPVLVPSTEPVHFNAFASACTWEPVQTSTYMMLPQISGLLYAPAGEQRHTVSYSYPGPATVKYAACTGSPRLYCVAKFCVLNLALLDGVGTCSPFTTLEFCPR